MKVVEHTKFIDDATFVPWHRITIEFSEEMIQDLRIQEEVSSLDIMGEYQQVFGQEMMDQIIKPLMKRKELIK